MKKASALLVLLVAASLLAVNLHPVNAAGIIFIKPDGTVEGTDKILRNGNIYSFTEDIEESYGIIVQAKNILIDGKGHKIEGTYRILPVGSWDFGIELANDTGGNVTVKNLRILNFNIGIYIGTAANTISGNVIKGGNVGITIAETPNIIVGNIIDENIEGIFLGPIPWNHTKVQNIFYCNSFLNNTRNVYDCECTNPIWIQHTNIWDNGTCGNYWGNYTGIDSNNDGIGDNPHQVTEDDIDSYPLMAPLAVVPGGNGFLGTDLAFEAGVVLTVVAAIVASVLIFVFRKRNKAT